MITTTVRMVDGIHCHTTSTGPATFLSVSNTPQEEKKEYALVTLGLELVERTSSFQQWLVDSSTTSYDSNRSTGIRADRLLGATGKSDTGLSLLGSMSYDGRIVSRGPGECSTISDLFLDVADDGSFGHARQWQHVTNSKCSLFSTVDECSSV